MNEPSDFLVWSFTLLTLAVALLYPIGVFLALRRSGERGSAGRYAATTMLMVLVWLTGTVLLAASGALEFGPMPPPIVVLMIALASGALLLSLSKVGLKLAIGTPLAVLVGVQSFRLPLELIMHRAYSEGVMPVQMSYSGWNFDVLTGASAIAVAAAIAAGRMPLWGVRLWNWLGLLLLANIVTIAVLSTPGPLRMFSTEPANVWISTAPFVWLPTVLVVTALIGHVLVFRRLKHEVSVV